MKHIHAFVVCKEGIYLDRKNGIKYNFFILLKHFSIEELQQADSNREIQEDKDGD